MNGERPKAEQRHRRVLSLSTAYEAPCNHNKALKFAGLMNRDGDVTGVCTSDEETTQF